MAVEDELQSPGGIKEGFALLTSLQVQSVLRERISKIEPPRPGATYSPDHSEQISSVCVIDDSYSLLFSDDGKVCGQVRSYELEQTTIDLLRSELGMEDAPYEERDKDAHTEIAEGLASKYMSYHTLRPDIDVIIRREYRGKSSVKTQIELRRKRPNAELMHEYIFDPHPLDKLNPIM